MAFKVEEFKASVRELARSYQFEAEIIFPTIVGTDPFGMTSLLIYSTTMPGRMVNPTSGLAFMGQPYKLAADIKYNDWKVNFRVDDSNDVVKKWRAWMELVHGTETNISAFPQQYKTNLNFYRLDGAGNRIIAITLYGAWPKEISQNGQYDTKNRAPIEMSVNLAYDNNRMTVL